MGGLLSAFKTKEATAVVLEFENATPGPAEADAYSKLQRVLDRADNTLSALRTYEGCQALVQKAISVPSDENVAACWEALKPAVGMLQGFYEYALELEAAFPELLSLLCDGEVKLNTMQALAKQLGAVLDFVIRFDHCKMNTPSIQNDFSYYRRSMQRIKANHVDGEGLLGDELANRMSLFYASPTPTTNVLVSSVTNFVQTGRVKLDVVLAALSVMASSTRDMLRNRHFTAPATNVFCLRSMVSSIILFDQLDANGAFCKKSPINVRTCVAVLREWPDATERVSLANMLRFTSRHIKDESTLPGLSDALNEAAAEAGAAPGGGNNNNN